MKIAHFIVVFICASSFFSCSSIAFKEKVEINENEDWLIIGSDPARTNISKSPNSLTPPYKLMWKFDADAGFSNNCLSASDGVLFSSTLRGEIFAVNIENGKSLGRITNLGKGSYSAPAIYNGGLIFTFNGDKKNSIINYDVERGTELWSKDIGMSRTSPVLVDNDVYVSSVGNKLYNLDKTNGRIRWIFPPAGSLPNTKSFYTSPTVFENMIIIGNTNGIIYSLDKSNGIENWKFETSGPVYSDASIYDSKVYFGSDDSLFYCLNKDGKLLWKRDLETTYTSSPSFWNNNVIVSAVNGAIYSLDGSTGETKWKYTTDGAISASPVIHGGKIFIGSMDMNFYCINADDGSILWQHTTDGRIRTTALIWKNFIFVASEDRQIYCFTPENNVQ